MRNERRTQVGVICSILLALLVPAASAVTLEELGLCGDETVLISNASEEVDINCTIGALGVSNSTVNLVSGAHISNSLGNGVIQTNWDTGTQTINIYGGQVDTMIHVGASDTTTIYVQSVDPIPGILEEGQTQIIYAYELDPWDALQFYLEGDYQDGTPFSLPFSLETTGGDAVLNIIVQDTPPIIEVTIDIKPGSDDNAINLGANGVIPAAILSNEDFDATVLVDPDSLVLGGASVAVRGKSEKLMSHAEDVNGDGYVDLVCQFDSQNFTPDIEQEGNVYLEGALYDGTAIKGQDWIIIVPQ